MTQAQGFEVRLFAAMKRKDNHDVVNAYHRLTDAAEQYVNRFPRLKRIQEQRSVLLDAIANAQLILSVHQLPKESSRERPSSATDNRTSQLEKEVKALRGALKELETNLRPVSAELEAAEPRAGKARTLLNKALTKRRSEHDATEEE